MCGRYASTRSATDLSALFDAIDETEGGLVADYNIAPTDPVPIVRHSTRTAGRVLSVARWGLVPHWARDTSGAARMINARAETVATARAFAVSFGQRRCLVPADGWYEWRRGSGGKQAYFMTRPEGLAFAGVWAAWASGDRRLLTCSILTTAAVGELAEVHDRMPLVLPPDQWPAWLTTVDATGLLGLTALQYAAGIEVRPVGPAVGDVRNDGPDLIRAVNVAAPWESIVDQPPTLF
ncbi:MAG: SOS response-associated peptidase [Micromonosporaceae bacterium]